MKDHAYGLFRRWGLPVAIAALGLAAAGAGVEEEVVHEDARLSGKLIHTFTEAGESVSVVLGDFRLTLGRREVRGRDAVLWIRRSTVGQAAQHDITAYVEGRAAVVEAGRTVQSDDLMLVAIRQQGRLFARGALSERRLADFPLYQRALTARRAGGVAAEPATRPGPAVEALPGAASQPGGEADRPRKPLEVVPIRRVPQPVSFHARGGLSSEVRDKRRVTAVRGLVLTVGDLDSYHFIEMTADAAVLFSEKRAPQEALVPWAPKLEGAATPLPGPEGWKETLVGVYAEGDVVIRRGERMLRGPAAYYDFDHDRSYMPDAVFRTIQEQRDIPIYIRAKEARQLSIRETAFRDAKVSTNEFYCPSYHIGARTARVRDDTPFDAELVRVGRRKSTSTLTNTTFNVRGVPLLYWPRLSGSFEQGHTPLRKLTIGSDADLGTGVETEWHLFRLLGLVEPDGYRGRLELSAYRQGFIAETNLAYARENYFGYWRLTGVSDQHNNDDFGDVRKDFEAPTDRGRALIRHKQYLPEQHTELQFELSYICDRNFLEKFANDEFQAGKEQETLLYSKTQRDTWALTGLLQYRLNRFDRQAEAAPEAALHVVGEPLPGGLTFFSENRAGWKRYEWPNYSRRTDSRFFQRLDTRQEVDWPLHFGPLHVTPYAAGRLTQWGDALTGESECRQFGQVGARANMTFWRVYPDARSRVWDVDRLKHIVTPEVVAFLGDSVGASSDELYPMDPDIETLIQRRSGVAVGLFQRLQTQRGPKDSQFPVNWMEFNVIAGFYDNGMSEIPSDGRFFFDRPELSLARNHINGEYIWNLSDSTTYLADANYDMNNGQLRRLNMALAVSRSPRLQYYLGWRWIRDLDSSVGTFSVDYQINPKYGVRFTEEYNFDFRGSENAVTAVAITRKFPRWIASLRLAFLRERADDDDFTIMLMLWPEGIPEVRLKHSRISLLGRSDEN